MRSRFGWIGLALALAGVAAGDELKTGNNAGALPRTAADELRTFVVPAGFSVELVASEETGLPKPVSVAFDDAGRMWAVTATEYPRDNEPGVWNSPGKDRVVVFDAPLGPGPHRARVFADGMVMPMGVLPYGKGAIVAQGPEMLYLEDTDGDGKADRRSVLLHGFGTQDTHTMAHQLEFAPGNWIAFSQGVLNNGTAITATGKRVNFDRTVVARFRPDGSDLEVIGAGLNNIWSWVQDRAGQVFVHEANDFGYSVVPFERDASYPSFIKRLVHPDSPYHPPTAPNLNLGGTGFSGLALSDDREGSFPDPWHDVLFVANPITRKINSVSRSRGADGVYRFKQLPDLLSTDDEFFRPVAIRFGPDGCLYIVDWYNRIISHNEIDRNHPARDKTRGRVWRVRSDASSRHAAPDVAAAPNRALPGHLRAPGTWEMRAAWHQIVRRNARELLPKLVSMARDPATRDDVRIAALWSIEGLGHFDASLWRLLLASRNEDVRREAVRALSNVRVGSKEAFALLQALSDEPTFRVRYEVIRYFRDAREAMTPEQTAWLRRWQTNPDKTKTVKGWDRDYLAPGGTYESAFQNLLLQMVDEKGRSKPAVPQSGQWMGSVGKAPAKSAEEKERLRERIQRLVRFVDAAPAIDPKRGKEFFDATCAACHSVGKGGNGFAPSLAGSRNRTTEAVLTAIIDPSQAVEGAFRVYHVQTRDGETVDGFFGGDTAESLTVRFAGGNQQVVPIKNIRSAGYLDGTSVMPDGLVDALDNTRIAELVRHVQSLE